MEQGNFIPLLHPVDVLSFLGGGEGLGEKAVADVAAETVKPQPAKAAQPF